MSKFQKPVMYTPARERLAYALKAKADASDEMAAAHAVIERLDRASGAAASIAAELAGLDSAEAAAMSAWASDPAAGDAPMPDADRRAELQRRLSAAQQQAASAQSAKAAPQAVLQAASTKLNATNCAAWVASKHVLIEEAQATPPPLAAAIAKVFEAKRRVEAARQAILSELNPTDTDARDCFVALEAFDRQRQGSEFVPLPAGGNEFMADWVRFSAQLLQNATALMDGPDFADAAMLDVEAGK